MTKSTKGTIQEPNMRAKAKSGLNRVITQQGWGIFFNYLEYKLNSRGGTLVKVNPQYTSQTCSCCGYVAKENRKTQAKFVCLACGYEQNADINSAKNILERWINANNASQQIAS